MVYQQVFEKVLSCIDRDEHIQLLSDLVSIPSPPGGENDVAEFIAKWFMENGVRSFLQYPAPNRPNAIGFLKGNSTGNTLIFNGHTDSAFVDPAEVRMIAGDSTAKHLVQPRSHIEDGHVCGLGVVNDKGPVSAFMIAAKALKQSDVKLQGNIYFTAVCGEIERAPVGEFQGPQYLGAGLGTRHLLGSGIRGDYALVAEPSGFAITGTLAGAIYLKITTYGESIYIPDLRLRSEKSSTSQNAIENMQKVIQALTSWAEHYEVEGQYKFKDGVIIPKMNIGAIDGGLPYKPNYSAGICNIYVDVRIPPFKEPLRVKNQIEETLRNVGLKVDIEMYRSHKGYEARNIEPFVKIVEDSYEELFHARPPKNTAELSSRWNDVNAFNEVGIPAIKCGPGTVGQNRIKIDHLVAAAKLYTLVALKTTGQLDR